MAKNKLYGITKATLAALLAAGVIAPSATSAATGDVWVKGQNKGSSLDFWKAEGLNGFIDAANDPTTQIESNGSLFKLADADAIFAKYPDADRTEVLDKLPNEATGTPIQNELKVESVTAINTTVYKAKAGQTLPIQINGNKVVTVAELEEAGYTVSFASNAAVFTDSSTTSTTGELLADLATIETFNYKVIITKDDATFTTATAGKVTVVDGTTAQTITEVELQKSSTALATTTVALADTGLKLVPTKGTDAMGNEITTGGFKDVKYTSSNEKVALIDASGNITPVSAGTTTLTVTSGNATKAVTLTVKDEARVLTTVKADVTSVAIVEKATKSVTIKAFDQFGDEISSPTPTINATSAKTDIATIDSASANPFTVTGVAKGSTSITVKVTVSGTDKTITIPVTVGENKVDSRKLEIAKKDGQSDDAVIDVAKAKDNKVDLVLNEYNAANQLIGPITTLASYSSITPSGLSYEIVEKDAKGNKAGASEIVDVDKSNLTTTGVLTLTAKKAGTVTVNIYEGALKIDTITVTVNDSTPTVTGATLIKDVKITDKTATPVLEVKGLTFDSTLSTVKFTNGSPITITDGSSTTYGKVEVLGALTNGTARPSVDGSSGNLAVTVTPTKGSEAVTGMVAVRITNNAGNIVFVGTVNVDVPANEAPAAPGSKDVEVAASSSVAGKTSVNVDSKLEYRITDSAGTEKQTWKAGTGSPVDSDNTVEIGYIIEVRVKAVETPGNETPASAVYKHTIKAADIKAAAAPNIASEQATNTRGATKLTGLTADVVYEYVLDDNSKLAGDHESWSTAVGLTGDATTIKDDLAVNSKTYIHIRVKATTTLPASEVKDVQINAKN